MGLVLLVAACGGGGGGGDDDDGPTDGPRTEAHAACIDETNRLRQLEGRPPVEWWADLEAFADDGAEYDHHNSPHDHFSMDQGERIAFAENECPRWGLDFGGGDMVDLMLACIEAFYSEGPGGGHYDNMMGDYGTLGCGIYEEDGLVTIVQDFGF